VIIVKFLIRKDFWQDTSKDFELGQNNKRFWGLGQKVQLFLKRGGYANTRVNIAPLFSGD
jgi:hypothetical protein